MDEATRCGRIALIQSGEILSIDTPQAIVGNYRGNLYALQSADTGRLIHDMQEAENIRSCYAFGEFLHVAFARDGAEAHRELNEYLGGRGHSSILLRQIAPGVEDCFIDLMNKE
jgi:ABC-type multidrug transport system ATPase subunit